jgi:superfamily II DNA/RNA helicase
VFTSTWLNKGSLCLLHDAGLKYVPTESPHYLHAFMLLMSSWWEVVVWHPHYDGSHKCAWLIPACPSLLLPPLFLCVLCVQAKSCVLLCTDVAARGLDFPAVSSIIQYDPAGDPAEYVHRVGRTARMGQHGEALLFLLKSEVPYIDLLQQRGMQLQQERPEAVLRCLPALLAGSDPGSAGSVQRLARKLRQEAGEAAGQGQQQQQKGGKDAGGKEQRGKRRQGDRRQWSDGGLSGAQAEGQAAGLLLQRQLLLAISGDSELQPLALNAFRWVQQRTAEDCDVQRPASEAHAEVV